MPPRLPDADADDQEDDLWFLPGPDPEDVHLAPLPRADDGAAGLLREWQGAEAALAVPLARVAARLGALDDRLNRVPEGWRHRLTLIESADLGWFAGDRVAPDRLALWLALRLSGVQDDALALGRLGWAFRRLLGGPGPEAGLPAFLGRQETGGDEPLGDQAANWGRLMADAGGLHPITRGAVCFHLWALTGLDKGPGAQIEAGVTAARIAASDCAGARFLPLAMAGAGGLRAGGDPLRRLGRWYSEAEAAVLTAMRMLDRLERWRARAATATAGLSGRTPPRLLDTLAEWPLVSAPMAEDTTGASRAAVQRNLAWLEAAGLIREVTGQGRFRFWTAAL